MYKIRMPKRVGSFSSCSTSAHQPQQQRPEPCSPPNLLHSLFPSVLPTPSPPLNTLQACKGAFKLSLLLAEVGSTHQRDGRDMFWVEEGRRNAWSGSGDGSTSVRRDEGGEGKLNFGRGESVRRDEVGGGGGIGSLREKKKACVKLRTCFTQQREQIVEIERWETNLGLLVELTGCFLPCSSEDLVDVKVCLPAHNSLISPILPLLGLLCLEDDGDPCRTLGLSLLDVGERDTGPGRGWTREQSNEETGVERKGKRQRSIEGVGLGSETSSAERLGVCGKEGGDEGGREEKVSFKALLTTAVSFLPQGGRKSQRTYPESPRI